MEKRVQNFGIFFDDKKGRLRQASSRGMCFFDQGKQGVTKQNTRNEQKKRPPAEGNGKKHENLHETVIRRTFQARS